MCNAVISSNQASARCRYPVLLRSIFRQPAAITIKLALSYGCIDVYTNTSMDDFFVYFPAFNKLITLATECTSKTNPPALFLLSRVERKRKGERNEHDGHEMRQEIVGIKTDCYNKSASNVNPKDLFFWLSFCVHGRDRRKRENLGDAFGF